TARSTRFECAHSPCSWYFSPSFFFSSRRRHTRFSRDWSSDVCSSDLALAVAVERGVDVLDAVVLAALAPAPHDEGRRAELGGEEIGRASCRERVEISVVGVS